jgi:hypothetical protein
MKGQVTVTIWPEDICNAFTAEEFVNMYGKEEILKGISYQDVLANYDTDSLLELIGEERINEFLFQATAAKVENKETA